MLNIVIPMAGAGSRFSSAGYADPKPLIPINGIPMIEVVINNLRPSVPHRFIFICQQGHIDAYDLRHKLNGLAPGCKILGLAALTEGAACTVLTACELIDNNQQLMIANSDQYIDIQIDQYLGEFDRRPLDGLIMTMKADDPKWSYVSLNDQQYVTHVVEKEVISSEATVGIYNFRHGRDFVQAARTMIASNLRVNNEFYVAPTYNQMIESGQHIGIYNIGAEAAGMYGLGTPADLELFNRLPILHRATRRPS